MCLAIFLPSCLLRNDSADAGLLINRPAASKTGIGYFHATALINIRRAGRTELIMRLATNHQASPTNFPMYCDGRRAGHLLNLLARRPGNCWQRIPLHSGPGFRRHLQKCSKPFRSSPAALASQLAWCQSQNSQLRRFLPGRWKVHAL
jgi:hypothetical protein